MLALLLTGIRKERGNYKNLQARRLTRQSSQYITAEPKGITGPAEGSLNEPEKPALTPEQLIERILEAEPPEIYLMKDAKRPLTEASIMMLLTNLADKELVHMISWAKKIPGVCFCDISRKKIRWIYIILKKKIIFFRLFRSTKNLNECGESDLPFSLVNQRKMYVQCPHSNLIKQNGSKNRVQISLYQQIFSDCACAKLHSNVAIPLN